MHLIIGMMTLIKSIGSLMAMKQARANLQIMKRVDEIVDLEQINLGVMSLSKSRKIMG